MTTKTISKREQFLNTYSGKDLIKKYPLDLRAVWQVRGEDSNCDFGGSHFMPTLGYYEGTLDEVIDIAVNLPNFWQWGGGGDLTPIKIKPADKARQEEMAAMRKEREELLAKVAAINEVLGE